MQLRVIGFLDIMALLLATGRFTASISGRAIVANNWRPGIGRLPGRADCGVAFVFGEE
jgi:hypothetical protein